MKTCVILDNESIPIKTLKIQIQERNDLRCVHSFMHPQEGIDYIQQNPIDIAFINIQMSLSGLKIAKQIPKSTIIIFTADKPDYAIDAFNLNAADYLILPISTERLNQAIDRAICMNNSKLLEKQLNQYQKKIILIRSNQTVYKITADEIIYIERLKDYLSYNTLTNNILALGTLKDNINDLPKDDFLRIHKSIIINTKYITSYNSTTITLYKGCSFNIGRVYKQLVKDRLKDTSLLNNKA